MGLSHIEHRGENFFFLRNQGNYKVYYNDQNAHGESQIGVYYIAVHKMTGRIIEWCSLGKGELKKFLEWLDYLQLPKEA